MLSQQMLKSKIKLLKRIHLFSLETEPLEVICERLPVVIKIAVRN